MKTSFRHVYVPGFVKSAGRVEVGRLFVTLSTSLLALIFDFLEENRMRLRDARDATNAANCTPTRRNAPRGLDRQAGGPVLAHLKAQLSY